MPKRSLAVRAASHVVRGALSLLLTSAVLAQAPGTVAITWAVPSAWSNGFQADLTIVNQASWTIYDWQLDVDFSPPITSIWNGSVTTLTAPRVRFAGTGASWDDGDLSPGETIQIGMIVGAAPGPVPLNLTLNGAPMVLNGAAAAPPPPAPVAAPPWPTRVAAPYVDATAWPTFDLVAAADQYGQRFFNLAFVVATSATDGTPSWGGYYPVASGYLLPQINALRARGGDVMVSFGGAAGVELAAAHATAASLQAAYQATIDAYGLTHVDFDIEGAWVADPVSIARRSQAIAGLQAAAAAQSKELKVWFTLPVLPSGLTADGQNVVASALAHGVDLAGVNVMAMDYGASAAPNPAGQMGTYAIAAATATHAQLLTLYAAAAQPLGAAAAWRKIGVTPMIGQNDVPGEIFFASDAAQLVAFADGVDLPLLSFWSMNRDMPCPGGPSPWASPSCHSLLDPAGTFVNAFRAYTIGVFSSYGAGYGAPTPPALVGVGALRGGDPFTLTISGAPPAAASVLVVGGERLAVPYYGAVLLATPDLLVSFATDAAGSWSFAAPWPSGLPPGTALRLQAWHLGGPLGIAASAGLEVRTP